MLYVFDLGNVIVDIDFNRVLGVWSDYSRVPLANLQSKFTIGESFHLHERGQISDEQFAQRLGHDLGMALSYEQFTAGWQAIFVGLRKETIAVMQALREQGHRVVVLSNTNQLHCEFWPGEYPEVAQAADKIYLSQQMGMRKPDAEIYLKLLEEEGFSADNAVFFDDNEDNIKSAQQLGITAIMVTGKQTVPDWFAKKQMLKDAGNKKERYFRPVLTWSKLLYRRIDQDNMMALAGNLAYVSLLSLVPLVAVIFALFAVFPVFADISVQLRQFVFTNFMPATGDVIEHYIDQFIANANRMTAMGAAGLVVTSLLLMYAIDSALNTIWRSQRARPPLYSFALYWMILTLGPLLIGTSVVISSYLLSQRWASEINSVMDDVLRIFPLLLSWLSFWLLYSLVPTVRVPVKDAVIGAIIAAALFEFGKKIFTLYIQMFPSYQLVYGVLAVIPLLFIWVYWTWCIVLLGAEITVTFSDYRQLKQPTEQPKLEEL